MSGAPPRVAVMLSGTGRTLANLLEAARQGRPAMEMALVIASRECRGAEIGREAGIPTLVIPGRIPAVRLEGELRGRGVEWVALAGYLNLVEVPLAYAGRIVNIHPALLPRFGGKGMHGRHVHGAVLAAGERESGCTVHLVDAAYDTGPIVLQERCPVLPGDTPESLAARVFEVECRAYPAALARLFGQRGGPPCV
jgi:phosphoribosylglycinamide formyltransferase 1